MLKSVLILSLSLAASFVKADPSPKPKPPERGIVKLQYKEEDIQKISAVLKPGMILMNYGTHGMTERKFGKFYRYDGPGEITEGFMERYLANPVWVGEVKKKKTGEYEILLPKATSCTKPFHPYIFDEATTFPADLGEAYVQDASGKFVPLLPRKGSPKRPEAFVFDKTSLDVLAGCVQKAIEGGTFEDVTI